MKKKELKKNRIFAKNTGCNWYDWFINHTPKPIRKTLGGANDRIMNLFNTNYYSNPKSAKTSQNCKAELKIKKQSDDNIIKNMKNTFKLKQENKLMRYRIITILILFRMGKGGQKGSPDQFFLCNLCNF